MNHNKYPEAWETKCLILLGMHGATTQKQRHAADHTLRHQTPPNNRLGIHQGVHPTHSITPNSGIPLGLYLISPLVILSTSWKDLSPCSSH